MGISNLGLKISPEVEIWPFLRMRSRKLAKTYEIVVQFPKFLNIQEIWHGDSEKSNLRSNFPPKVVLWPFLRMRIKSGQNDSKPAQNLGYVRNRVWRTKIFKPEGQLWPFLCMRNSKLGKKQPKRTSRRRGPFAKTSRGEENMSYTTLLIKRWSNVRRNALVSNNSRMSIDRP